MLYIVERNVIYCEKSVVKPKVHRMCLAVQRTRLSNYFHEKKYFYS